MRWLLPRVLVVLMSLALGGALGRWVGAALGAPELGAVLGAAAALGLALLMDLLRGARLMRWLREGQAQSAPRDAGFWGELGYRIERALLARDAALAQEQRRLSEFLSAIEASPNGVLLLDARDQIDWCSPVAADHLGLDARRDRGQAITNLVRSPAFVGHLQASSWPDPVTIFAPGGQAQAQLQVTVRAYGDHHKLVTTQDVTERLRADAMRRDFVANVSHEIRTPLTVLAGYVETMSSLPLSEAERRQVLTVMQQQTDRMQALVSDLLALAQLEGGARPPPDRWLALAALLQQAAADGRTLSAGRHQIDCPVPPALVLAGLESELLSAVANLVSNAVRYTPAGGRIHIAWLDQPDGGGRIEVRDTGPGIAPEHLPRLTERFYRVDSSRSRDTGGTGLGLAIVKHVLQRHGGALQVQSELGQGACFSLVLPAARVRRPA